jgi:hypothetical protein
MLVGVTSLLVVAVVALVGVTGLLFVGVVFSRKEREGLGDVERAVRRCLLDRLVEGGLEAGDVEDEVCLADLGDLLRAEFEVMRLSTGRGQIDDLDGISAHLLCCIGQWVEARDDAQRGS